MKVYTKTGDTGSTSLFSGERVAKSHPRVDTYGTFDELTSHIGFLSSLLPETMQQEAETLLNVQKTIFSSGALLATPEGSKNEQKIPDFDRSKTKYLEQEIDRMTALLPPQHSFIIPGGAPAAAQAHIARSVCRRAERLLVALIESEMENPERVAALLAFVNRLSDYLFVLARFINKQTGTAEKEWLPNN